MKNKTATITLGVILTASMLFILSCTDGLQNNTVNTNKAEANVAQSNQPEDQSAAACPTVDKMRENILKDILKDTSLANEYNAKMFSYSIDTGADGKVALVVGGRVSGPQSFVTLTNSFEKYLKKGCVEKLTFQATPLSAAAVKDGVPALVAGFEWTEACQDPLKPCNNTCSMDCGTIRSPTPKPSPTPTP